jgi:N4-(beta-N-acetylglucosaminyl)-L-asparaginase
VTASRSHNSGNSATAGSKSARPAWGIAPELRRDAIHKVLFPPTGTIHCSALNEKGEISGCTTTRGLAFKLSGRCGDSPIIGAGCYTDQDVGRK